MTLQGKVHDLLVDAGAAQGIKPDEAMVLLALGNDTLLSEVKAKLKEIKTDEEYAHICQVLDEAAAKHRAAQAKAVHDVNQVVHEQTHTPEKSLDQQIAEREEAIRRLEQI